MAPGDVEREALAPGADQLVTDSTLQPLPFKSTLVASQDDPYCSFERAQGFAAAWGADLVDAGAAGHINADSGLGDWPQGQALLNALIQI